MSKGTAGAVTAIPLIPLEIMDGILRTLRVHWVRDLCSCALVCRTWREFTRPHLFQELSFAFETPSVIDFITSSDAGSVEARGKTLDALIRFLEHSPHIRPCVQKLTLRRRSPISSALLPNTQSQLLSLLSPQCLPSLRHLALVNVLFVRPFVYRHFGVPKIRDPPTVPPLESLHIHFAHDRYVCGIDILYLLSIFDSVHHLAFTGRPTITDTTESVQGELNVPPYRYVEPTILTFTNLFSYVPFLRMASSTVARNVRTFSGGLFDICGADDSELIPSASLALKDGLQRCDELALYYTLLDRIDRCHPPDFSFCKYLLHKFTLQFSLYEEDDDQPNSSIWALASKLLSTLIPTSSHPNSPFHLHTIVLKISGREQPTNWLPELYDHHDLIQGLDPKRTPVMTRLVEDVLLSLLEARDLFGDDSEGPDEGSFVVRLMPHDHMPAFDAGIQTLIRQVFPRLNAMNILRF